MKENTLRESIKEDLAILGIQDYQNILGFRRIYGNGMEHYTVVDIINGLSFSDLTKLRDLIKRTFDKNRMASVAKQS
jgi:hypothetical protein